MNNKFNLERFGKVLKHDGLNFFPNFILTLAILWAIPVVIYLFTSLMPTDGTDNVYSAFSRISVIDMLTKIVLILAPARLYKYCNDSRKGIGYAMLPASTLEKFLSMVIFCVIVAPIVYVAGALAIDSILALFNGPYEGFAISNYFNEYAQIDYNITAHGMTGVFYDTLPLLVTNMSPALMTILSYLGILMISSIFMFGNMVFKKRKTGKMIGVLILLSIIFMIIFINFIANNEALLNYLSQINEDNVSEFIERFICIWMNVTLYTEIIVSAVMLWGTYRKIKTQKY
ncbi:MAG: hypothetical protein SPK72_03750 [Bacteroidales bacterium]|jgi:hypothetical protein|nr:hypothetical protein [Bacteroidales bacterium]